MPLGVEAAPAGGEKESAFTWPDSYGTAERQHGAAAMGRFPFFDICSLASVCFSFASNSFCTCPSGQALDVNPLRSLLQEDHKPFHCVSGYFCVPRPKGSAPKVLTVRLPVFGSEEGPGGSCSGEGLKVNELQKEGGDAEAPAIEGAGRALGVVSGDAGETRAAETRGGCRDLRNSICVSLVSPASLVLRIALRSPLSASFSLRLVLPLSLPVSLRCLHKSFFFPFLFLSLFAVSTSPFSSSFFFRLVLPLSLPVSLLCLHKSLFFLFLFRLVLPLSLPSSSLSPQVPFLPLSSSFFPFLFLSLFAVSTSPFLPFLSSLSPQVLFFLFLLPSSSSPFSSCLSSLCLLSLFAVSPFLPLLLPLVLPLLFSLFAVSQSPYRPSFFFRLFSLSPPISLRCLLNSLSSSFFFPFLLLSSPLQEPSPHPRSSEEPRRVGAPRFLSLDSTVNISPSTVCTAIHRHLSAPPPSTATSLLHRHPPPPLCTTASHRHLSATPPSAATFLLHRHPTATLPPIHRHLSAPPPSTATSLLHRHPPPPFCYTASHRRSGRCYRLSLYDHSCPVLPCFHLTTTMGQQQIQGYYF
ncbi:hypothetical protein C7M84_016620 [Penaeus vannamei]|uniref:Uncharacterized protein n=1 Tax=Penaeus vannamei TaxID=6689 RepID=A0A423U9F1_PENVA|nr:hypothetical protein C7M84_016620 [Penaeus vannamei]